MRAFVPASARVVLDLGCGDGAFADGLRAERREQGRDLEIWGVELDEGAAARAEARLDRVIRGSAENAAAHLPEGRFDCIVCNDILEHLVWPDRVLAELRPKLAPGGVVVASIPNVRYFHNVWDLAMRGAWDYQDEGIRDRTHLRFYTRTSMHDLFAAAGFRLASQTGINPTGSWRFRACNALALGRFADMRYLQFACVAEPVAEAAP
jgi:2-polyprenyl-3-methyl-5-hydroxy-6-metoxy-1,4-benzoquinol methylase